MKPFLPNASNSEADIDLFKDGYINKPVIGRDPTFEEDFENFINKWKDKGVEGYEFLTVAVLAYKSKSVNEWLVQRTVRLSKKKTNESITN